MGECLDNVPEETRVVSVMIQESLETVAKARDKEDDRLLLHPTRRQKQTDGEEQKSSQGSGNRDESSLDKSEIPCRFKFCKKSAHSWSWFPSSVPRWRRVRTQGLLFGLLIRDSTSFVWCVQRRQRCVTAVLGSARPHADLTRLL